MKLASKRARRLFEGGAKYSGRARVDGLDVRWSGGGPWRAGPLDVRDAAFFARVPGQVLYWTPVFARATNRVRKP